MIQTYTESIHNVSIISNFIPTHIYLPLKSVNSHPYRYLFALFLPIQKKLTYVINKSFQISTKQVQK